MAGGLDPTGAGDIQAGQVVDRHLVAVWSLICAHDLQHADVFDAAVVGLAGQCRAVADDLHLERNVVRQEPNGQPGNENPDGGVSRVCGRTTRPRTSRPDCLTFAEPFK